MAEGPSPFPQVEKVARIGSSGRPIHEPAPLRGASGYRTDAFPGQCQSRQKCEIFCQLSFTLSHGKGPFATFPAESDTQLQQRVGFPSNSTFYKEITIIMGDHFPRVARSKRTGGRQEVDSLQKRCFPLSICPSDDSQIFPQIHLLGVEIPDSFDGNAAEGQFKDIGMTIYRSSRRSSAGRTGSNRPCPISRPKMTRTFSVPATARKSIKYWALKPIASGSPE